MKFARFPAWFVESVGVICILTGLTVLFFPHAILSGKTLLPADLLYFYSPWREQYQKLFTTPSNWILFDELFEFAPWREFARAQLLKGVIPLWDSGGFCGYPFLGALQTGVFYPFDLALLPVALAHLSAWRGLLHILIAGLGMYWFLRTIPLSKGASYVGSSLFPFCGFMIAWFGHPHFKVAAWLPWILLFVRLLGQNPTLHICMGLTLTLSFQYLAGHIETTLHLLYGMGLYALWFFYAKRRWNWRFIMYLAGANTLSIFLAMAQLLPFAEYLANSGAYAARKHGVWVKPYFSPDLAICMFQPKFYGCNADNNYFLSEFNSNEVMAGYVGVVPLIMGIGAFSLFRKKHELLRLLPLLIFSCAVTFRIPGIYNAFMLIPGMKMSYNFRFLLLTAFSLIAAFAIALDLLIERLLQLKHIVPFFLVGYLINVAMYWFMRSQFAAHGLSTYSVRNILIFSSYCLSVPLLVFILRASQLSYLLRMSLVLAVTFSDLWNAGYGYNKAFDPSFLFPRPDVLSHIPKASEPVRVLPLGHCLPPHTHIMYDFYDVRGNDALTPLCIEDYLSLVDPRVHAPTTLPAMRLFLLERFHHWLIDDLGIQYLITPQETRLPFWLAGNGSFHIADYPLIYDQKGIALYENLRAKPRAFAIGEYSTAQNDNEAFKLLSSYAGLPEPTYIVTGSLGDLQPSMSKEAPGAVKLISYAPHEAHISADMSSQGIVVLSDTYFPGWNVSIDGVAAPMLRVNHALRGVLTPAGKHTIVYTYAPFSFRFGLFLSLIAMTTLTVLSVSKHLQKRKEKFLSK